MSTDSEKDLEREREKEILEITERVKPGSVLGFSHGRREKTQFGFKENADE